jgi:hypothetical protein
MYPFQKYAFAFQEYSTVFFSVVSLTFGADITDVCLDENAVSSDPVLAFLLDEVVIKDWCKKAVNAVISDIGMICILQCSINFISICILYLSNRVSPFMHPWSCILRVKYC